MQSTDCNNTDGSCDKVDINCSVVNNETKTAHADASGCTVADDPYSYLSRGDYTSEAYKLELMNLPKRFGIAQLKKKLLFCGLNPCKIKTVDQRHYAFVTFRNEADMDRAISVLQGLVWKNKSIKVKKAHAAADPLILKRKSLAGCSENVHKHKMLKPDGDYCKTFNGTPAERLNNVVTPLWKMPYVQQLQKKDAVISRFMRQLGEEIEKNNKADKDWLLSQKLIYNGLCCSLLSIKPSPVTDNYRNKCEFTIGVNSDGTDNVVGFRVGSYRDGDLSVLEPGECIHVPTAMKTVAMKLQQFLQTQSTRSSFNPITRQGYWRTAVVRVTSGGRIMLNVVIHPQTLTVGELEVERDALKQYFESMNPEILILSSLYFDVASDRRNEGISSSEVLLGEKFVEENLLHMKFQISPSAFFQVNTPAAEMMYCSIGDLCENAGDLILLDVCCGTGTIGLTMAHRFRSVIGIDVCQQAIDDAKTNAKINDIKNADFVNGKVEDVLPSVLRRCAGQEVIMVVDPPRSGLHSDVVRLIRRSSAIRHLVYVSCKPSAAKQNLIDLTREMSKRISGCAFRLKQAIPFDMFPHTEHYELLMMLER